LNNSNVGRGAFDLNWKAKHHNSIEASKTAESLNNALIYLLKEQSSVIDTFKGTCIRC